MDRLEGVKTRCAGFAADNEWVDKAISTAKNMLEGTDTPNSFALEAFLRRVGQMLENYKVAREDIPWLLAEVERLRGERDDARKDYGTAIEILAERTQDLDAAVRRAEAAEKQRREPSMYDLMTGGGP